MEDLTGRQFGPYRITAAIGEGGMAAVYRAYQPAMDRAVALKVLPRRFASDPEFIARFHREVKIIASLQHPHILPVYDFGEADGYPYIVMPYIKGGALSSILQGRPLPLPQIRLLASQVGAALDYAHRHDLIHRDVKPGNVLIDESGNCLLTDFGLAKTVEGSATLTNTGMIMGTPAYMSPEQALGQRLDARSDIYSLGVVLYEMATGRTPYSGDTPMAVAIKHIHDPLPSPRSITPALDEGVEHVIQKALAKRPGDRFETAGQLVNALQLAIPAHAPAASATNAMTVAETAARPARFSNWVVAAGLVVLLAAVGGTIAYVRGIPARRASSLASEPSATTSAAAPSGQLQKVCFVSVFEPTGGTMDDLTWQGIQSAVAPYGARATYVVATRPGENSPELHVLEQKINGFISASCDLIVTSGFSVGDTTAALAKANPRQRFLILDFAYDPPIENVSAYLYATDQGAFLAGYVAAAVSRTGKVGTFGGFQFPTVESYMDGFALGVAHYNAKHGTRHETIGWNVATRTGYFANEFSLKSAGEAMGRRLLSEGADVIFPVAGFAGVGAADAVREHGNAYIVGVDTDWAESYPEHASLVLTSVEKRFNLSAISAITALAEGRHDGGTHVGTVANGEVGIAPFHQLHGLVSLQVEEEVGQLKTDIISGKLKTRP